MPEIWKIFKSDVMTTFLKYFLQNAWILKSRVSVSNYKSRVSEVLMKSRFRSRLEILTRSRSRRLRSRLHHCWTYCMHNHCFPTCYRCKIWVSLRKLYAPPVVQSWLRVCWWLLPCGFCQLCHSAQFFTIKYFRFNIKFCYGIWMSNVLF